MPTAVAFRTASDGLLGTTRSIAYGFWFAAAALLVLMAVAGRKWLWRRTTLPVPEGWVFVTAAVVLTVAGAGIDAAGT